MRPASLFALLVALPGCKNSYDLFRVAGYQQESFQNSADVLFIVDNSESMLLETQSLVENFGLFIQGIAALEEDIGSRNGLSDAVDNYVAFAENRAAFVDFQFAVTTTDPGDKGEALGTGVVGRSDPDLVENFIDNVLCEAACMEGAVLPSEDYQCGDDFTEVSEEYVECACGANWESGSNCGTSDEAGLESVFLAMCQAVEAPPVICFEDYIDAEGNSIPAPLDEGDILKNEGLLREGANFVPVVVTDEGDSSNRINDGEGTADEYLALYEQFNVRMTWVSIAPTLDQNNQIACRGGSANDWNVQRYAWMSHLTDGRFVPIDETPACVTRDFEEVLTELGELLSNLLTVFPLQSVPVPGTITAVVDGKNIPEAEVIDQDSFGLDIYSDGWSYRTADNSVEFHGTAIPDYNAEVHIYYLPVDGMPRELPF